MLTRYRFGNNGSIFSPSIVHELTANFFFIGMNAKIGDWSRVEGTPNDPNPNKPFAKTDNYPLFNQEGKLNPSITIVGKSIQKSNFRFHIQNYLQNI